MGVPVTLGGGGLGIVLLVAMLLLGGNVLGGGPAYDVDSNFEPFPELAPPQGGAPLPGAPDPEAELVDFVSFVLDDVQATWDEQFAAAGRRYEPAQLVVFREAERTGCGLGTAETGPFYCPADTHVYLDLGFFRELRDRFGAPGDFAQAYVIAHEIAHHVQNLLGISDEVRRLQQANPDEANDLSVRLELQADCLAGVWGHSTYERGLLEPGDLREGLDAAAAVGDDRIQAQATGRIDPETWTHGSAEQRTDWFRRGFDSGDLSVCDTFAG